LNQLDVVRLGSAGTDFDLSITINGSVVGSHDQRLLKLIVDPD